MDNAPNEALFRKPIAPNLGPGVTVHFAHNRRTGEYVTLILDFSYWAGPILPDAIPAKFRGAGDNYPESLVRAVRAWRDWKAIQRLPELEGVGAAA